MKPKIHIASCRKIKAANKQNALQQCIWIDDVDLLQIDYVTKIDLSKQNFDAVVFTSQHAVKALEKFRFDKLTMTENLLRVKCFCIEGETSKLALTNGFNVIATAATSKLLAQEILKHSIKSVLFFCGDEHLEEWIFDLKKENVSVEKRVVYFKNLIPHQFENMHGAMFFSPSQVEAFLLKNDLKKEMPVFSIGETTAETLINKGFENIFIAENKSEESVMEKVIEYFKK